MHIDAAVHFNSNTGACKYVLCISKTFPARTIALSQRIMFTRTGIDFEKVWLLLMLFQVLSLDDTEMQWVVKHLAHTMNVHQTYYRVMSATIE